MLFYLFKDLLNHFLFQNIIKNGQKLLKIVKNDQYLIKKDQKTIKNSQKQKLQIVIFLFIIKLNIKKMMKNG